MAKRKSGGGMMNAQLPIMRQLCSFGATATTEAFTTFDTGIDVMNRGKWSLLAAFIHPADSDAAPAAPASAATWFHALLWHGEKTAEENVTDGDLIAYGMRVERVNASGGYTVDWPLKLYQPSPKNVYASKLTLELVGSTDYNSKQYLLELVYIPQKRAAGEMEAFLMATGNLS